MNFQEIQVQDPPSLAETREKVPTAPVRVPLRRWPRCFLMGLLRLYQRTLSRWLPPTCRFTPSCSEYAVEALDRYGVWQGGWYSLRRVLRCHPFHPGGYDPVPGSRPPAEGGDSPAPDRERENIVIHKEPEC